MNENGLTYFELVEIWAVFTESVETAQSIEESVNSKRYSASVRKQELILAKLETIKNHKFAEMFSN